VLGRRIDYRLALGGPRLFSRDAKFIQVDIHAPELGMNRRLELGLCADVRQTLDALLAGIGKERGNPFLGSIAFANCAANGRVSSRKLRPTAHYRLHPAAFFAELKNGCRPIFITPGWR